MTSILPFENLRGLRLRLSTNWSARNSAQDRLLDPSTGSGQAEVKLSVKNWARLLEVSQDTASRDVKDLVAKQILRPVKGRVRDVSYAIIYSNEEEQLSHLTELNIEETGDYYYLTAIYDNMQQLRERITVLDYERCQQGEFDLQALACKYFAYIR